MAEVEQTISAGSSDADATPPATFARMAAAIRDGDDAAAERLFQGLVIRTVRLALARNQLGLNALTRCER